MGRIAYVDKDNCTSCSQCADNLPQYFQLDDNDTSETHINGQSINQAEIPDKDIEMIQREMEECPGECIHWKE